MKLGPGSSGRAAIAALLVAVCALPAALAAGHGEPGPVFPVRIELGDKQAQLQALHKLEIDIDGVFQGWARAYVIAEEYERLAYLGFQLQRLPDEGKIGVARLADEGVAVDVGAAVPSLYHTYATLTADLQAIATDHPEITRLYDIGKSVQNRSLWMMQISRNPDEQEFEPELLYIAAMHGDEVVGKELCFNLINYLTDNYGSDPRVTDLVDGAEIWIMPSMNPDGTELGQRYNANGYDLNRNFPDQFVDPVNDPVGRPAEVARVMNWTLEHRIDLSANLHGGTLVVNYPFDSNPAGTSTFSPTPNPDHPAFYSISRSYADNNLPMYNNHGGSFDHGVTNGADWYSIHGGMQDWRYVWHGGFEVTIELSNVKWPPADELPAFWDDNLESILSYFERGFEGLNGIVTNAVTGEPVEAEIRLDFNPFPSYTDPDVGDYHRIVLPGTYDVEVSASGFVTHAIGGVEVLAGDATRLDVALSPEPAELQPMNSRVEDGAGGNGRIDAGETVELAVTLENLGAPATSVSARLQPVSWYADVTRPHASYPDIPTGGAAESLPPHHEVSIDPAVPSGHQAGFYLDWESEQGRGRTEAFFVGVGDPVCETLSATDVPQPISLIKSPLSEIQAPARNLFSLRVSVDIRHTYIGDLVVLLTAPSGGSVVLHNASGGSSDDIVGTYPDDLTPAEPLTSLLGPQGAGAWRLTITDSTLPDVGTLESWSIELCAYPPEPTPALRFRDLAVEPGGVALRWWEYPGLWSYRVYRSTDPSSAAAFLDVTAEDDLDSDTRFLDSSGDALAFYLVTGVGPQGEGPKGHFGE